ncbi:MAG: segregation/condensation protein A [Defluviitaleaceae bacterium]|nr:segregation/condensation protein A [Defluviitaleaceae bacterium]
MENKTIKTSDTTINLELEHFSGPMDLLVHLIEQNKISIENIPISALADQYIAYLSRFLHRDLGQISSFVLMAARLLELKTRALLPKKSKSDPDNEIDDAQDLAMRLAQYQKYKGFARLLGAMDTDISWYRQPNTEYLHWKEQYRPEILGLLMKHSLPWFFDLYWELLARKSAEVEIPNRLDSSIQRDPFTIEEKILQIIQYLKRHGSCSFGDIYPETSQKLEKLTAFMAILELAKGETVHIDQNRLFAEIFMKLRNPDSVSEQLTLSKYID